MEEYILVTAVYSGNSGVDMKIPASMTAEEFTEIMRRIYGVSETALQAEPPGIMLNKKLSFASQQVEHGALLTFIN